MKKQLFVGNKPQKEKMKEIVNREAFVKPYGGLWTSTFNHEFGSDWIRWCNENDWYKKHDQGWLLIPEDNVKLFVIDSYGDLVNLANKYSEDFLDFDMVRNYFFDEMAKDYDGIHLTERGHYETHLSQPYNLYGWDCESILWFRWKFKRLEEIDINEYIQKRGKDYE